MDKFHEDLMESSTHSRDGLLPMNLPSNAKEKELEHVDATTLETEMANLSPSIEIGKTGDEGGFELLTTLANERGGEVPIVGSSRGLEDLIESAGGRRCFNRQFQMVTRFSLSCSPVRGMSTAREDTRFFKS